MKALAGENDEAVFAQDAAVVLPSREQRELVGAEDFYYPPAVEKAAEKWLSGSVMNGGDSIDDLTRVLIGWDDVLTPAASSFLNDTSSVTANEVDTAMKAEWRKKWH